jgi:hypothetical protein
MRIPLGNFRTQAIAATCGLGLLLNAAPAHAERARGLDSHALFCQALQSQARVLLDEYRDTTDARRGEILPRLRSIGRDWQDSVDGVGSCQSRFGTISPL